jgi:prophage tail gpP-like protein
VSLQDKDERQLAPNPGENIGAWIARICEYYKLLCWLSSEGEVVLTRPRYDQINLPVIRVGGPVVEGSVRRIQLSQKPIDASARIEVCGRVGRDGASQAVGVAENTELIANGWKTYRLQVEEGLHDAAEAQKKADRILHDEKLQNWVLTCTLSGHALINSLLAPDRMAHIIWPAMEIDDDLYCIARDFSKNKFDGTICDLTFVKPNLLLA